MTFVQLQLLIASTNEQTAEPALFWSWTGAVALCSVIIACCGLTDYLLRRGQRDHILLKMSEFQEKLERLPIGDWQLEVASMGVKLWVFWGKLIMAVGRQLGSALVASRTVTRLFGWIIVFTILGVYFGWVFGMAEWLREDTLPWYAVLLRTSAIVLSLGVLIAALYQIPGLHAARGHFLRWVGTNVFPAFGLSIAFTVVAAILGVGLCDPEVSATWFNCGDTLKHPYEPGILSAVNFIFDYATIYISVRILRYVVQHKGRFVRLAALDVLISAILAFVLHVVLLWLGPTGSIGLSESVAIATTWFSQLATLKASSTDPNWPLTPILFTTFIPVTIYMSAFLFLGILVKPFARTAAYLCGLLWEKKQTPFLVFAVALSGMLTLTKAFSEWRWFLEKFGG